ncbi:hypothetical protein BO71DRAFT_240430 [Aspergillus ellipticus CBS 707.79]|uniref:Uncharacterized protein n=1 Tax=Aspergillus ellipticus CBS 707.79 TaxID=1448320 RepID=A0A319DJ65_9EURO|nr:hypothetical protein BO71DRAFT_240430 [Aspergillus ellipticus CBS 707.79]
MSFRSLPCSFFTHARYPYLLSQILTLWSICAVTHHYATHPPLLPLLPTSYPGFPLSLPPFMLCRPCLSSSRWISLFPLIHCKPEPGFWKGITGREFVLTSRNVYLALC